jgi:hypothetical protein
MLLALFFSITILTPARASNCPDLRGTYQFKAESNPDCSGFPDGFDSDRFPAGYSFRAGDSLEISQKGCEELTLSFKDPSGDPARSLVRVIDLTREEVHSRRIIHDRSHRDGVSGFGGAYFGTVSHRWSIRIDRKNRLRIRANASDSGWFSGPLGLQPYLEWRFARCVLEKSI